MVAALRRKLCPKSLGAVFLVFPLSVCGNPDLGFFVEIMHVCDPLWSWQLVLQYIGGLGHSSSSISVVRGAVVRLAVVRFSCSGKHESSCRFCPPCLEKFLGLGLVFLGRRHCYPLRSLCETVASSSSGGRMLGSDISMRTCCRIKTLPN
jgi:hypothetical protein